MKTLLKSVNRQLVIGTAIIAVLAPFLWNCYDMGAEYGRFWLLEPNITNQRTLLPFTYSSELYYQYGWGMDDTTYQVENVKAWKTMLGDNMAEKDIHQILYYTPPADFFKKKYNKKNSFIAALNKPGHAVHLQYLNFAKNCEEVFTGNDWDQKKSNSRVNELIPQGQTLLQSVKTDKNLSRRTAYLLSKLYRFTDQIQESNQLFEQYFAKDPEKDWLNAAAIYQNAERQTDSLQANIWLARAWDAGFYNPIWIWHSFSKKDLEASVKVATLGRDKAVMTIIPASREPGPALTSLQKAYNFDPTVPDLAKLMSREVNKLENWLLSPALYGEHNRVEIPYSENPVKLDSGALLKTDLAHLHACRTFVQQVISDKKRNDMAFWHLSGAHLAYLDQDFKTASELAQSGQQVAGAPANQKIQLQLMSVLAEIGSSGQITTETENKIPGLFQSIRQNSTAFEAPEELQDKLALLLSDVFIRKHEIAKGAFLLGKTTEYFDGMGYMTSRDLFDKLLEVGSPSDFDRAIQMVENPKTDFERWFAQEPHRYNADLGWDDKTQSLKPAPGQSTAWETDKLREFKAIYYTRRDQPDSALMAIKNVSDNYWSRKGNITDYDHAYFQNNPFSTAVSVVDVPLSQPDSTGQFNKRTFLEKLIALRNTTDPAQQQEAYFLLGNAYYNMTYYGRDWWLMMAPEKSIGELEYYSNSDTGAIPDAPAQPWDMIFVWSAVGVFTTALGGSRLKKYGKWFIGVLLFPILMPFACKPSATPPKTAAQILPFNDIYYRCTLAKSWYEKAIKINPDNDLGIAASYMAGVCEEHQQYYQFTRTRKNWDEQFKAGENSFYNALKGKNFKSPVSCAYFQERIK